MERCHRCRYPLDAVEYLEVDLWGRLTRVIIELCDGCGWSERTTSEAVPAPA